jgi:hypothetical protein
MSLNDTHRVGYGNRFGKQCCQDFLWIGLDISHASGQPSLVVADQQMGWINIFIDRSKAPDWVAKNIVSFIVIYRRNLANQHVTPVAPKSVPVTGHQGNAFTRREAQFLTRGKVTLYSIA